MIRLQKPLIVTGLALAGLAFAAQEGVLLRRSLVEGSVDTYLIESTAKRNMSLPGLGDQSSTTKTTATYEVKGLSKVAGKPELPVALTYTILNATVDGAMAGIAPPPPKEPMKASATLDDRGHFTFSNDSKEADKALVFTMAQSLMQYSIGVELPEKPVKIGDSWDVTLPKSDFYDVDQKLTVKLIGDDLSTGKPAYKVTTEGTIKVSMDLAKVGLTAANPGVGSILVKTESKVSGEGLVEKATGKTLKLTTKVVDTGTIEIPTQSTKIPTSGESTMVVTLK